MLPKIDNYDLMIMLEMIENEEFDALTNYIKLLKKQTVDKRDLFELKNPTAIKLWIKLNMSEAPERKKQTR